MKSELSPYTIVVDTREQAGYTFAAPLVNDRRALTLAVETGTLETGDYSLVGYHMPVRLNPATKTYDPAPCVACERKSLADLYSTLGQGRARFERELARLAAYTFAAVVVEAEWSEVLLTPPAYSQLHPRSVLGSVQAWQVRFPSVQWCFLPGREVAEGYVARLLDRFWREQQAAQAKENGKEQA